MVVRKKVKKSSAKKTASPAKDMKMKLAALKNDHKTALKKAIAKAYKEGMADAGKKAKAKVVKKVKKTKAKKK
jgi:hypothetical protein